MLSIFFRIKFLILRLFSFLEKLIVLAFDIFVTVLDHLIDLGELLSCLLCFFVHAVLEIFGDETEEDEENNSDC